MSGAKNDSAFDLDCPFCARNVKVGYVNGKPRAAHDPPACSQFGTLDIGKYLCAAWRMGASVRSGRLRRI
jgi:hypothetical protein